MRFKTYARRCTAFRLSVEKELVQPLDAREKDDLLIYVEELLQSSAVDARLLEEKIANGENIIMTVPHVGAFAIKMHSFNDEERLTIYHKVFPYFSARIHLPEQTDSKLALTKTRIAKRTRIPSSVVKRDIAKFRRLWPVRKESVRLCIEQERALLRALKLFPNVELPEISLVTPIVPVSAEKNMHLLTTYLAAKVHTITAGTMQTDAEKKIIKDLRKAVATAIERFL